MHSDLNIPCRSQLDRSAVDKLKLILYKLTEYDDCTVAFNYTFNKDTSLKKLDKEIFNASALNTQYKLKILNRVTLDTNESIESIVFEKLRETFDIIAIRTNNLQVFKEACQSYPIDIITLTCTERLVFELGARDIQNALDRHIYFEICYAPAIRDNQSRIYTLQLAKQLFGYTKGAQIIISSEAEIPSEIRQPGDIFYFAKSLGFPNDQAKFTTTKHCMQLLNHVHNK